MKLMIVNKIFSALSLLALSAGAAAVLSGCNEDNLNDAADKDSTVFRVTAEFPTQKGATMTITHNGPADCRYTGCVYDNGISMQEAIDAHIAELKESASGTDFDDLTFSGTEYSAVVTGLQANREYSYVVFGLNEDFTTYGTAGTCTFTTQTGAGLFTVNDVSQGAYEESAIIQVMPRRGYEDRTYFVFWTEDTETPAEDLIEQKIQSMSAEEFGSVIRSGDHDFNIPGNEILSFKDGETLVKGGKYRAIVTGMYPDGVTYGIPSETVFKTSRGDLPYNAHAAWTVTYDGKGIYNNSLTGVTPCENIRVTSTDSERFFISAVEGDRLSAFISDGSEEEKQAQLREVIADEVELLRLQIEDDPYNTGATWSDYTYTETVQEPFANIEDDSWWFGLAIGIDVDGIVTGEYAISEPFQAETPVATEGYNKWVGNWTVSGSYQNEDGSVVDVSFDIEIDDILPGVGYTVSGFGAVSGIMDENISVPLITVLYDEETENLQWIGSYLGPMTLDEESDMYASLYFAAVNGYDVIAGNNFVMAETSMESDGSASFAALQFNLSDGSSFTAESMGYVADVPYVGYLLVSVNPDIESLKMVRKTDSDGSGAESTVRQSAVSGKLSAGVPVFETKLANRSIL